MSAPHWTPADDRSLDSARRADADLSPDELARAVGISLATLARLMSLGLVEPTPAPRGASAPTFSAATASRLRRMLRLHRDLGVNFTGAAIIVELVERLERPPRESGP